MLRAYHRLPRVVHPRHGQRRGLLTDSFLELATALPYPASWPPYSTTIILGTVLSRLAIFPVSIWANNRMIRYKTRVEPALLELKPKLQHEILTSMQKDRFKGDKEAWKQEFTKRAPVVRNAHEKALCAEHNCGRWPTNLVPAFSQGGLFLASTYLLNRLASDPFSGFDAEAFLTLTSLAHSDESLAFPIATGLIAMANAESNTWFKSTRERMEQEATVKKNADKGIHAVQISDYAKSAFRAAAVLRILIASQVSGAIALYWTVSMTFNLLQTWWMERRREEAIEFMHIRASFNKTAKRNIIATPPPQKPQKPLVKQSKPSRSASFSFVVND